MTLNTLADVEQLLSFVPFERRALSSTWRHLERHLAAAFNGDDLRNVGAAIEIVLKLERVPYWLDQ